MNKKITQKRNLSYLLTCFNGKMKDVALVMVLGFMVVFAAWQIFHADETKESAVVHTTETEAKLLQLLEEIDGVGDANVIIYEKDEEIESVVVVCEGANNLRVVMNIREMVSTALGTEQKSVKIYLKKE